VKLKLELTEYDLKLFVLNHISEKMDFTIKEEDIKILVKSKQNYKSEWETAEFKAVYEKIITE